MECDRLCPDEEKLAVPVRREDYLIQLQNKNKQFFKKQNVDIKFRNIYYDVTKFRWKKPFFEEKQILHGVSGDFRGGELTAIMGPSGAGKSTLLNILAAYTLKGVSGKVYTNGIERNDKDPVLFKKLSCYIQQDEHLRKELSVGEAMTLATKLKLGNSLNYKQIEGLIQELLEMLGLDTCLKTTIGMLSGGQKKRLAIAFELITNPPVIFLDEPTTGLDSSSCSQCVALLKHLAQQGRTIICTIHQPSALIFEMFDHLYALSQGLCVYEGPARQLIPYLADRGLDCPKYHNPADFLLELASGDYGPIVNDLAKAADKRKLMEVNHSKTEIHRLPKVYQDTTMEIKNNSKLCCNLQLPNEFIFQLYYLYSRNMIIFQKQWIRRFVIFLSHVVCAILVGLLFWKAGNDAMMVRSNLSFVFGVLIFLIYVGKVTVLLAIPEEIKVLTVEHFNRWYSLLPFYLSLLLTELPFQAFNSASAVTLCYYLSDQPWELFRYASFNIFCTVTSLAAQSIGFFLGATTSIKVAVFIGPVSACVLAVFGFSLRFADTGILFKWLAYFSYFRSSFASIATILYGYDRLPLYCDKSEIYCHYKNPTKFLEDIDLADINIYLNLVYICVLCVLMHIGTYSVLYYKLNKR